jgi:serine/threonine protein kinase
MIRLFATYTTKKEFVMILSPVADGGDLYNFLGEYLDCQEEAGIHEGRLRAMAQVLERAFGCLADGLSFMRRKQIRHKDIKTRNILIHNGLVIYTDFGFSVDTTLLDNSMSCGPAEMTPRYAAPEVIKGVSRDSSSDMFSLGCVFVEMFSALCGNALFDEQESFSNSMTSIHQRLRAVKVSTKLSFLPEVIIKMTINTPKARCSADLVARTIGSHPGFSCHDCRSIETATPPTTQNIASEMSNGKSDDALSIQEGHDYLPNDEPRLELKLRRNLGHGHTGTVTEVEDANTGRKFACKVIRFRSSKLRRGREEAIQEGIRLLLSIGEHPHMIKLFGTYQTKREFGQILLPVADSGGLDSFISDFRELRDDPNDSRFKAMAKTFERAYGCLSSGLAYLHRHKIRHKNIKPQNILVHQGSVIYTGFSFSQDFTNFETSVTEGKPSFLTRRYAAPEVLEHEARDSSSDVFSLGCVFLELGSTLVNSFEIDYNAIFAPNMPAIIKDFGTAIANASNKYNFLYPVILSMTQQDRLRRSSAAMVASILVSQSGFCCTDCGRVS